MAEVHKQQAKQDQLVQLPMSSMVYTIGKHELRSGQQLGIAGGFEDPTETVVVTHGSVHPIPELQSDHEEADALFMHYTHPQPRKELLYSHQTQMLQC